MGSIAYVATAARVGRYTDPEYCQKDKSLDNAIFLTISRFKTSAAAFPFSGKV